MELKKTITTLKHQLDFLNFSKEHHFTLCGDEMGLERPSQL